MRPPWQFLYSYELYSEDTLLRLDERVRFLELSDFDQWLDHDRRYLLEHSFTNDLKEEQI